MAKMYFIPGMKPGHVKGATGTSIRPRRVERIVIGPGYSGKATPRNLVPYEEPRRNTETKRRAEKQQRARDVADAVELVLHQPNTARDRLNETYAKAREVEIG